MFTFSVLDLFLQVLSKKAIWHFDVTWLISQQFSRRDSKSVAFLVFIYLLLLVYQLLFSEKVAFEGIWSTAWKVSKYGVFPDPSFPVFNPIQENRDQKNSVFGHFSRSVCVIDKATAYYMFQFFHSKFNFTFYNKRDSFFLKFNFVAVELSK